MAADNTYDRDLLLKSVYAEHLLERFKMPDWRSPEYVAWAAEWQVEVPLTPEQERENSAWKERVKIAAERLRDLHAEYAASIEGLSQELGVSVYLAGEDGYGAYEVDDYDPPHKTTFRAKDGAPPAPPFFRKVEFRIGTTRTTETQLSHEEEK